MSDDRPIVRVDLMRPAPGIVRCCICFEARPIEELLLDVSSGKRWDICGTGLCAQQAGLNPDGSETPPKEQK